MKRLTLILVLALLGARSFVASVKRTRQAPEFAPPVTILKPLKGVDPRMYEGLASHCRQVYAAPFELVFGIHSLDDPAVAEVERLRDEFPDVAIKLVECTQRLGTSGKVSNLVQMLPHASYEHVVINDSDIYVSPAYLTGVMRCFREEADKKPVGMVTAPYLDGPALAAAEPHSGRSWKLSASPPTSCQEFLPPECSKAASASASARPLP